MAQKQIGVSFPADDIDLYWQMINEAGRRNMPIAWLVIEAIRAFWFFNASLAQAQEAAHALAEMRRLFGPDWQAGVKQFEEATREV